MNEISVNKFYSGKPEQTTITDEIPVSETEVDPLAFDENDLAIENHNNGDLKELRDETLEVKIKDGDGIEGDVVAEKEIDKFVSSDDLMTKEEPINKVSEDAEPKTKEDDVKMEIDTPEIKPEPLQTESEKSEIKTEKSETLPEKSTETSQPPTTSTVALPNILSSISVSTKHETNSNSTTSTNSCLSTNLSMTKPDSQMMKSAGNLNQDGFFSFIKSLSDTIEKAQTVRGHSNIIQNVQNLAKQVKLNEQSLNVPILTETVKVRNDLTLSVPKDLKVPITKTVVEPVKVSNEKVQFMIEQANVVKEKLSVVEEVKAEEKAKEEKTEVISKSVGNVEGNKPSAAFKVLNGDCSKEETSNKRPNEEVETESPLKKLCREVEKTFPQHDIMINEYIQTATKNNVDEIQRHTEQLLSEIQTLRELAQKKELEWNNILHLKKVKEEILLRLLRKKQVLSFEKSTDSVSDKKDSFDYLNQPKNLAIDKSDEISGLAIKQPPSSMNPMIPTSVSLPATTHYNPIPPPYDNRQSHLPKPNFPQPIVMPGPIMPFPRDINGHLNFGPPMGRQGPVKDVKSIIADYRQRHPECTPRRGRRIRGPFNSQMMNNPRPVAPKLDNLGMFFNNLDMNQKAMLERLSQVQASGNLPNGLSFKDILVQFANMQQQNLSLLARPDLSKQMDRPEIPSDRSRNVNGQREPKHHERHEVSKSQETSNQRLPPPPYPEISLLPVSSSSSSSVETTQQSSQSLLHGILTKNCGEITITPVQSAQAPPPEPPPEKPAEEAVHLEDEDSGGSEGSGGDGGSERRLVIDEGSAGEGVPLCQGCKRRDAQFVCAGCANQWYCSRDCQVAAWDEHSEMCSG